MAVTPHGILPHSHARVDVTSLKTGSAAFLCRLAVLVARNDHGLRPLP